MSLSIAFVRAFVCSFVTEWDRDTEVVSQSTSDSCSVSIDFHIDAYVHEREQKRDRERARASGINGCSHMRLVSNHHPFFRSFVRSFVRSLLLSHEYVSHICSLHRSSTTYNTIIDCRERENNRTVMCVIRMRVHRWNIHSSNRTRIDQLLLVRSFLLCFFSFVLLFFFFFFLFQFFSLDWRRWLINLIELSIITMACVKVSYV